MNSENFVILKWIIYGGLISCLVVGAIIYIGALLDKR